MIFFFTALFGMYIGRKIGWTISKNILYTAPIFIAFPVLLLWGVSVALSFNGLIQWQQPGIIMKIIMGYALGCYVAIPNFGLFNEASIPSDARSRHLLVSTVPPVIYILSSIMFVFLLHGSSLKLSSDVNDYPKLAASEIDVLSKIFSKAQIAVLSENDLDALKHVIQEYNNRTGTKIIKSDIDFLTKSLEITNEYYYELGQSLLLSWDGKSRTTTSSFDKVLRLVKEQEIRKPEKIQMDLACLDAAARNQNYVEDSEGSKFEFGREIILQRLRENEISRANFERIMIIFNVDKLQ